MLHFVFLLFYFLRQSFGMLCDAAQLQTHYAAQLGLSFQVLGGSGAGPPRIQFNVLWVSSLYKILSEVNSSEVFILWKWNTSRNYWFFFPSWHLHVYPDVISRFSLFLQVPLNSSVQILLLTFLFICLASGLAGNLLFYSCHFGLAH